VGVVNEFRLEVETYKNGKEGILNFLVGQVQKVLRGKGDPKKVAKALIREINA
jgi:aspartyl-tRNA(Asn)/glutamyl-tRNA(Gln) amidotransferase subunit B